jgi:inner membrane protein
MDNLTHTLTGLMLSRAGLNRLTPRGSLLLMLAANAPDLDIVSGLVGPARYIEIHRGYTHAWAILPLLAVVPVRLARWSFLLPKWARRFVGGGAEDVAAWSWWKAWLVAMLGIASHLLLDWTNNYGIRFGLPFDAKWHRLDILYVIDPWVWMLLLFGVVGPFLSRMVSLEIGAKRTSGAGTARFALIVLCVYAGGRYLLHEQAIATLSSRVFEQQNPRRVAAFPSFGNPFRWRAVAELGDGYWVSQINLREDFDPSDGRIYFQANPQAAMDRARETADFQAFLRFNQFPLWRVIPMSEPDGALRVELYDLRFGDPAAPGFVATAVIEGGRADQEALRFGAPRI